MNAEHAALQAECDSMLGAVDLFRSFVPSQSNSGSGHSGEEGRFVEDLLAQFLHRTLPKRVSVGTGFVLDPANNRRSYQVDILVYDNVNYPQYLRYGEAVVVPWQAVVAGISVKKNLRKKDIRKEAINLGRIGEICGGSGKAAPYLALFALESSAASTVKKRIAATMAELQAAYAQRSRRYTTNELIDAVIVLGESVLIKKRWRGTSTQKRSEVPYLWTGGQERRSLHLMHLIHGIERVLYEGHHAGGERPFARGFPTGVSMTRAGHIEVVQEDRRLPD